MLFFIYIQSSDNLCMNIRTMKSTTNEYGSPTLGTHISPVLIQMFLRHISDVKTHKKTHKSRKDT